MKNIIVFVILFSLLTLNLGRGHSNDYYLPIESCTFNKSLDEFLSPFHLDKIDKIVFKEWVIERYIKTGEKPDEPEILTTFSQPSEINMIITEVSNLKCIPITMSFTRFELWLYEGNKLRLKVALCIDPYNPTNAVVRLYKPEYSIDDSSLNQRDFEIVNREFCSWLLSYSKSLKIKH